MARHRRHRRYEETGRPENDTAASGLDLSNLAGIAGLLNNIDLSQVAGLLGSLNTGNTSNRNANSSAIVDNGSNENEGGDPGAAARKNELANALKVLINADKSELLQVALQFYVASKNNQNNISDNS